MATENEVDARSYEQYRTRRGRDTVLRASKTWVRATIVLGIGIWMIPRLVESGAILESDGELLDVLLRIYFTYKVLVSVLRFGLGMWYMNMKPLGEYIDWLGSILPSA